MADRRLRELERRLHEAPTPEARWDLVRALHRYEGLTFEQAHRRVVGIAPGDVLGRVAVRSGFLHLEPVYPYSDWGALCGSEAQSDGPVLIGKLEHTRMLRAARTLGRLTPPAEGLPMLGEEDWNLVPRWACSTCWDKPGARSALILQRRQRIARGELPWGCLMGDHFTAGDCIAECAIAGCNAVWERGRWREAS